MTDDVPTRIRAWNWIGEGDQGQWYGCDGSDDGGEADETEYVRSDMVAEVLADIEKCGCPCCAHFADRIRAILSA